MTRAGRQRCPDHLPAQPLRADARCRRRRALLLPLPAAGHHPTTVLSHRPPEGKDSLPALLPPEPTYAGTSWQKRPPS